MDRTRKYPEGGNPITKKHTWYALTDKWILAQKLQITRIQFTDHMIRRKTNKKEDQSVGASLKQNKILTGANMEIYSRN